MAIINRNNIVDIRFTLASFVYSQQNYRSD